MLYFSAMKRNKLTSFFLLFPIIAFCLDSYAQAADGKATYQQYCSICHASGLAGAPKFQSAEDWNPRLKQQGINGLVKTSMTGLNGVMPPKGTCMDCTEQQLKDAIEYMLPPK